MRVLITGGREFNDMLALFKFLDDLHNQHPFTSILHGNARGADKIAGAWARSRHMKEEIHPAQWQKHGLAAGPIRNQEMLDTKPNFAVAFPGGKGTADMVRRIKKAGLPLVEFSECVK